MAFCRAIQRVAPLAIAVVPHGARAAEDARESTEPLPAADEAVEAPATAAARVAGTPAAPMTPLTPGGCVPDCRTGYVCMAYRCVSLCNPECPVGYTCLDGRRCVADAQPSVELAVARHEAQKYALTVRNHDGFYLRAGFNLGYGFDTAELPEATTTSRGIAGFIEYAIGANVGTHFVLAFAHYSMGIFSPTTTINDERRPDGHTTLLQHAGVLLDFYPNPARGWHVSTSVGFGMADIGTEEDEGTNPGFGASLGGGHDFWVGDQWSLGVMGRLIYINGASDDFGEHRAFVPMLAISALLH